MTVWRATLVVMITLTASLSAAVMDHRVIIDGASRPEHLAELVRRAGDLDAETQNRLIMALARMQVPASIPLFEALLPQVDSEGTGTIIQCLVSFPHGSAADLLSQLCAEAPPALQAQVLEEIADTWEPLIHAGHAGLRTHLRTTISDPDHPQRYPAAAGLMHLGLEDERTAAFRVLIEAPDDRLPAYPSRALIQAKLGDAACLPSWRAVLAQDFELVGHNAQVDAAMAIGQAVEAGVALDQETRTVLIATVRDCPHYDPASFAAKALAAEGSPHSYEGLIAALATTQAGDATFHALWAIDPDRALADCRRLVTDGDPRAFDVALYGVHYPNLIDVFTGLLERDPDDLDPDGRARRSWALQAVIDLRWPISEGLGDRQSRAGLLATFFNDDDVDLARYAMQLWLMETDAPYPQTLLPRIRGWLHGGDADARADAIFMICARRNQFAPELAALFRGDLPEDQDRRVLEACCMGIAGVTIDQIVTRLRGDPETFEDGRLLIAALRHHPEAAALVDRLLLDGGDFARRMTNHAAGYGDGDALRCLVQHVDADRADAAAVLECLTTRRPSADAVAPIQRWLWRMVDELADRDAAALVAVMAAHEITPADDERVTKLLSLGRHALLRWDWSSIVGWDETYDGDLGWFDRLRSDLVTLHRRWGVALPADEVLDQLLHSGRVERLTACAQAQLIDPDASGAVERSELRRRLFVLAEHDVPAIRAEALRALADWVGPDDFDRLWRSCRRDPAARREALIALVRADAERASRVLVDHHDLLATWLDWFTGADVRWYWDRATRTCREHAVERCRASRDAWLAADLFRETNDPRWESLLLEWRDVLSGPQRSEVEAALGAAARRP